MEDMKRLELLKEFPAVPTEQWEEVIKKDLKGADYAKRLLWHTDDGITVKPYYRAEDLIGLNGAVDGVPGEFPFVRGTKAEPGWHIREEITEADPGKANELARRALQSGTDEICFVVESGADDLRGIEANTPQQMNVLLSRIPLDLVRVHFRAGSKAQQIYEDLVAGLGPRALHLTGSIDYDPLGDLALTGASALEKKTMVDQAAGLVSMARKCTPSLQILAVRGWQFHESGGTTVQELGCSLAQAIEYVSELSTRGLDAEQSAQAMFFSYSVGTNYFFEIAKLRVARSLWAQALAGFDVSAAGAKATIHARTSNWGNTIYDSHVNLLRGTTEAMAAAIGGCDSLAVAPFDECHKPADDFSRRLARNTQIILKKEAYLDQVVDPAAGSYYVEALTQSIAREAWTLMQQIEQRGGFFKCLEDGWIQKGIEQSRQAKNAAIAARRQNLLGTNQFPNQKDRMLPNVKRKPCALPLTEGQAAVRVEPLGLYRGAEVFEALRLRMERHAAASGRTPRLLMLEIGNLKMRKARSAFCTNFFACGGFEIVDAIPDGIDAAVEEALAADPDIVVLCSSDEEYPQVAGPFVRKLRDSGKAWPVIVAGFPKEMIEKLRHDGVADFVHVKSNAVEVLKAWQQRLGVRD